MSIRTVLTTPVPEKSNRTYTVTVNGANGPVPLSSIVSILATLIDKDTKFVFFQNLDVKNNNGGVMAATSGVFEFDVTPFMNGIVHPLRKPNHVEHRVLTLDFVYNTDDRETHEVEWPVESFGAIT